MHYIPPQKICQTSRPAIRAAANGIILQNGSKVSNGPRSSISQRSEAFPPNISTRVHGLEEFEQVNLPLRRSLASVASAKGLGSSTVAKSAVNGRKDSSPLINFTALTFGPVTSNSQNSATPTASCASLDLRRATLHEIRTGFVRQTVDISVAAQKCGDPGARGHCIRLVGASRLRPSFILSIYTL